MASSFLPHYLLRPLQVLLLFLLISLSFFSPTWASPLENTFTQANRAYTEGNYDAAIENYEKMIQKHGYSPAVLFNLANAYYEIGNLGKAILNYERTLLISPQDPDALANLKLTQKKARLEIPQPRWWQQWITFFTPNQWAWLASSLLTLFVLLKIVSWFWPHTLRWFGIREAWNLRTWRFLLTLLGLAFFLAVASGALSLQKRHYVIVISKRAPIFLSPFAKAEEIASLPEGDKVAIDKKNQQHGDFVRIRYGKKKLGWVRHQDIASIEPHLLD